MIPATVDYTVKTLLTGYRIGLKDSSLYAGIPAKFWTDQTIRVRFKDEIRVFCFDQIVTRQQFNDKYRPGEIYALDYVLWRRVKKGALNDQAN